MATKPPGMRERRTGRRTVPRRILWSAPLGVAVWAAWSVPPTSPAAPQTAAAGPDVVATAGELQPTAEWFDFLFGGFSQRRETRPVRPVRRPPPPPRPRPPEPAEAYRTLCVRLCDGYYFPISFSTRRDRFASDASKCERQCPARSRLYVYRNPGEQIEDMRDLKGKPYLSLPTALLYRTQYIADCTCRDSPSNQAAPKQHNANADESAQPGIAGKAGRTR